MKSNVGISFAIAMPVARMQMMRIVAILCKNFFIFVSYNSYSKFFDKTTAVAKPMLVIGCLCG